MRIGHMVKAEKSLIIGVIVALVVGFVGGFFAGRHEGAGGPVMASQDAATSTASTSTAPQSIQSVAGAHDMTNPTVAAEDNSVSVGDQPAGSEVAVQSVTLTQEGWIAIRDSEGLTLGAALFPAGTHAEVSVPLLRATVAGQNYQVLLYFDNGNKEFDLNQDTLVENPDGSIAGTTFDAQ